MSGTGVPRLARVLCVTDLSDAGDSAIPFAYAIAAEGGTVRLLHVVVEPATPSPLVPHYTRERHHAPEELARIEAEIAARLRSRVPAGAAARGVRTEVAVHHAAGAAERIRGEADAWEADVICMASRSRPGISSAFFGSVARDLLSAGDRPVLLVRPPAET